MSGRPARLAALALAGLPLASAACGICIEDKVAATYDDAIVSKAAEGGRTVAFFEIDGMLPQEKRGRRQIVETVEGVRGVQRGTVRLSREPAAMSFATEATAERLQGTVQAVNRRLMDRHLRVKLVRIFYRGELRAP